MSDQSPACLGPLDPLCGAVGGLGGDVAGAGSGFVLDAFGQAFVRAADSVTRTALSALDTGTQVDLTAAWFRANVAVIAAITVPVVVGLLAAQVMTSVARREPGGLSRALVGLTKAFVGAALALGVTQAALLATDGVCEFIAASSGTTVHGAAERFLDLTWLAGPQAGPVLQMLLGVGIIFGCLALWAVLLFRKAALLLVAVFAPIAFAGAVFDQTRVWVRRWIEIVAALVLCKVVIVVTFVLGASAFSGVAPTMPSSAVAGVSTPSDPVVAESAGLSDVLVGLLLLAIACFAPWLTFRFVHWSGMEAASVMHSSMAANPASKAVRATGAQARSAAQQGLSSAVHAGAGGRAGAGSAARGAHAHATRVARPASRGPLTPAPSAPSTRPAPRPIKKGDR